MAAMNPVELRIIIDAQNKASATLKKAQKQVKDLQNQTAKIGGSQSAVIGMGGGFKGMGRSAMTAGLAIGALGEKITALAGKYWIFAAGAVAVGTMSKSGALLEARMAALGGSFDATSKRIRKLSDDSGGAFSMPEIVDAENKIKAFNIGLKLTPDVLTNIQGRAAMMGITTTKALDDVILGISRGSRKILDNIGIVVSNSEANKIWAQKLGKSVHQLTDAERRAGFLSLTMRELNKSTLQVTSSYGASLKASAHMKDGLAALQLAMAPLMKIAEPVTEAFMSLARIIGAVLDPVLRGLAATVGPFLKMFSSGLLGIAKAAEFLSQKFIAVFGPVLDLLGLAADKFFPMLKKEQEAVTAAQKDQNKEISEAIEMYRRAMGATEEAADAQDDLADATGDAAVAVSSAEERQAQFASQADTTTKKIRTQEKALEKVVNRWNQLAVMVALHGQTVRAGGWLMMKGNEQLGLREHFQKISLEMGEKARKAELEAFKRTREMFGLLSKRQAQDNFSLKLQGARARHQAVAAEANRELLQAEKTLQEQMEAGNVSNEARIEQLKEMDVLFDRRVKASQAELVADEAKFRKEMEQEQQRDKLKGRGRRKKKEKEAKPPVLFDPAVMEHETKILRMKEELRREQDAMIKAVLEFGVISEEQWFSSDQQHAEAIEKYDNSALAVQHIREQFDLLAEIELQKLTEAMNQVEFDRRMAELKEYTVAIEGMNHAFRQSAGVMGSISPSMAVAHAAMGEVATNYKLTTIEMERSTEVARKQARDAGASQEELANITVDSSKTIAGGITAGLGAMGPAVAGFVEGTRTQAGVMAAFETAMAVASWWKNPAESLAHAVAAGMFAGIASGIISTPSSASAGGRGLAGTPGGFKVPGGGGEEGPRQIVINFTDGMILGDPQSIAKKINETLDQASGTGSPAGV